MPSLARRLVLPAIAALVAGSCTSRESARTHDGRHAAPGAVAPPVETPSRPVANEYHGVKVVDEYQWLENWDDAAVKAWSDAQNAHARRVLDALPNVEAIRARVTEISSAPTVTHYHVRMAGGKAFAMKRQPPKQQPFIVVMDSLFHPDAARTLVDPAAIDAEGGVSIDWFKPSHDGRLLAVSMSKGGSEAGDVHVFDVASGKQVFEVVPRVNGGTAGGDMAWTPDSTGFFYSRYPRGSERSADDMAFYVQVYFHKLGTPTEGDRYEVGKDFPRIAEIVLDSDQRGHVLASMQKGDGGEFQHYLRAPNGWWTQITTYEDQVKQACLGAGEHPGVYLLSRKGSPRGKILRVDINADGKPGALAGASTVIPEGKDVIVDEFFEASNMLATPRRLYLTYQLGGPSEVRVFDLQGKALPAPSQPEIASVGDLVSAGGDDAIYSTVSFVQPLAFHRFDAAGATSSRLNLVDPPPVTFDEFEVVREFATSKDGTKVPVNIIRRKGLALTGDHPCLVTGYGGYGVNMTPGFRPNLRVLLERGFVWAQVNIRGGGEYGDQWHKQGNLLKKQNVFDDFAAACRHMIDRKYTSSSRLAIEGGSNGGLLMGATFTQHPALAAAVVSHVGIYDMLRVELSPNGAFNITEFGTVKDEAQFRALHAYSPYHHVKESVRYPSILFLTGANDPRVDPMQSRKMTARLQAVGAEALLRTSSNSGHGQGTALAEQIEQRVDVYAFLCDRLGAGAAQGR